MIQDPEGSRFPWRPRPITQVLEGASLVHPDGKSLNYSDIKNGYKGIYFSANWVSCLFIFNYFLKLHIITRVTITNSE